MTVHIFADKTAHRKQTDWRTGDPVKVRDKEMETGK